MRRQLRRIVPHAIVNIPTGNSNTGTGHHAHSHPPPPHLRHCRSGTWVRDGSSEPANRPPPPPPDVAGVIHLPVDVWTAGMSSGTIWRRCTSRPRFTSSASGKLRRAVSDTTLRVWVSASQRRGRKSGSR